MPGWTPVIAQSLDPAHPGSMAMHGPSVEVDTIGPGEWDQLAARFSDVTYDQTASGPQEQWGPKRLSRLVLRRAGQPVAAAQVVILTVPPLGKGLAYVKFGPLWRRLGEAPDLAVYRQAVSALVAEYCVRRGHSLTLLPRPNPDHLDVETGILRTYGFKQRRRLSDCNRYLVDVAVDPADQLRSLDQKWRYNLRQALRAGVACRMSDETDDLSAFEDLNAATQSRKGFRESKAIRLLPQLARGLPASMRPRLAMAVHEGRMVAGAVIALLGDTAYYVFGASSDAVLPLKAGYALQWWIVNWLSEDGGRKGVRWYDLGGEMREPGLRQFKKGLAGKAGAILEMPGEFDYWTNPVGHLVADGIYSMRAAKSGMRALLGARA
jgi:hypothetical protein